MFSDVHRCPRSWTNWPETQCVSGRPPATWLSCPGLILPCSPSPIVLIHHHHHDHVQIGNPVAIQSERKNVIKMLRTSWTCLTLGKIIVFRSKMSKKRFFTFKNFQNVYWHGKQHSAMKKGLKKLSLSSSEVANFCFICLTGQWIVDSLELLLRGSVWQWYILQRHVNRFD